VLTGMAWAGSTILKNYIQSNIYDSKLEAVSREVAELEKTVKQTALINEKIRQLNRFSAGGTSVTAVLKELTLTVPESAWISDFEYSDKGLEIAGYADSASNILTELEQSSLFRDVSFVSSIRKRYGKDMFKIGFKLN
ncbi:MAG: PilN domain-containing protein, partial [Sodalinema sp.]|uniref:PilN domain-containing protein n=1 Tax=Sodalinema sp. TaxID=3080550 RepID=UPI00396F564D